jgi:UDP-N-acetylmuramyl tripeptide synthase
MSDTRTPTTRFETRSRRRVLSPRGTDHACLAQVAIDCSKRPLMGMVAARLSDLVVLTSDNPRSEDPMRIIEEVRLGAEAETRQSNAELLTIVDRREAITQAISRAATGDVVLIA